jgi:hypothetical protein
MGNAALRGIALKGADGAPGAAGDVSACWPVGSVFTSVVATNPSTLLGFGTWTAIAAGRVLVGLDSGDANFDTAEETGGAKTVQASAQTFGGDALATHQHAAITAGTPAGSNDAPAFTGTQSTTIVNHTHDTTVYVGTTDGTYGTFDSSSTTPGTAKTITTGNPKSGGAASYTPAGTVAAPTFTGTELGTHQHAAITAGTPSGTNTPGAATSVVQPYFVCYFWKRVS